MPQTAGIPSEQSGREVLQAMNCSFSRKHYVEALERAQAAYDILEDLRDHLRRTGIRILDDQPFQNIPPAALNLIPRD